jgi:hypothetical protein
MNWPPGRVAGGSGGKDVPVTYGETMRVRVAIGLVVSFSIVGVALVVSSRLTGAAVATVTTPRGVIPVLLRVRPPPTQTSPAPLQPVPAAPAIGHLDPSYTRAASICPGLDPAVLAAIHIVETRQSRDSRVSIAGAIGPMQFLPGTWAKYGMDGNGDGRADIRNFSDALFSAAHYLCANGANVSSKLASAVWHYNHSQVYTAEVLALAQRL